MNFWRSAVQTCGTTTVGVLPTHRRRGVLTKLMERQLADAQRKIVEAQTRKDALVAETFAYAVERELGRGGMAPVCRVKI